jgi:hypothetical protein
MVLVVRPEVVREVVDPLGEHRHLHAGRTGVLSWLRYFSIVGALSNAIARTQLRALRVGHRPADLGIHALAAGGSVTVSLTLHDSPISLQRSVIEASRRCHVAARAGEAALTLWDEARKALTLTTIRRSDGPLSAQVLLFSAFTDPRGNPIGTTHREFRAGSTARPFQSLSPGLLSVVGYVTEEPDGTVYRAPDANVLLSREFAAEHCLKVVDGTGADAHLLGLGFEPIGRDRDIVRISGTLWLDRASFELRRLEYRYVGLAQALERAGLGGSVEFTRLPSGIWFENRWEIRMPRTSVLQRVDPSGRFARTEVLDAIQRTGGEVWSISLGDEMIYAGAPGLAADSVVEEAFRSDPRFAVDSLTVRSSCAEPGIAASEVGRVAGTVRSRPARRIAGASVRAEWKERFNVGRQHDWSWVQREVTTTSATDGFYSLCGLPVEHLISLQARREATQSAKVGLRIAPDRQTARVDLWLPSAGPLADDRRASIVQVRSLDGAPIPYAVVSVGAGTPRVADADGRAVLPPQTGDDVRLRVRRIGYLEFDGPAPRDSAGARTIVLAPAARDLDAVTITAGEDSPLRRSGFYDRIAMAQAGAYTAEFITPEEIRERNPSRATQLLAGRRAVNLAVSREATPRTIAMGRGGCPMTVLVDGQRINIDLTPEGAVPIDDLVHGRAVAAIEIYASNANAPAELVPLTGGGSCGIIAIWTGAP